MNAPAAHRTPGRAVAVYGRATVALPDAREAAAADTDARGGGVPERVLMENAGRAAAQVLHRLYPRGRVVALAGSGNNGGDALVMLRVLQAWGRDVCLVEVGSRAPESVLAHGATIPRVHGSNGANGGAVTDVLSGADIIVDGMLGTGAEGAPRGAVAAWIDRVNAAGRPVLALDLPSGVNATTGRVAGNAVAAEVTVTFGWPKLGLLLQPGRQRCGRLVAVEIGFPDDVVAGVRTHAITPDWVRARMQRREADAHKGSVGRLMILAGSSGMAGAAVIAAEAALRAGAGLVRVASSADNRVVLQSAVPEATFLDRSRLDTHDAEPMHALVAGPGMGESPESEAALRRMLELTPGIPTLLDADALNVLAGDVEALLSVAASRPLVITPHAKELSRLTGSDVADIVADAPAAARAAAERFGCAVLLKGQPSMIAEPDGTLRITTTGSSDVATAGMGDQLAGTAGALLHGAASPAAAAAAALLLSGRAADLCGLGVALTPRDVSARMPEALADPGLAASELDLPFITFDQPPRW